MKSVISKTTHREIRQSLGRYCAILAIVALGVGFFAGLKVSKQAMVYTVDHYVDENALFDFRLLSSIGFKEEDVAYFQQAEDAEAVEGSISTDILYENPAGSEGVLRVHTMPEQINRLVLTAGRLPEHADECVMDSRLYSEADIGKQIRLSENNSADTKEMFQERQFNIVGIADSVYYMNFERGNSSLGNGKVEGYMYIPSTAWDCDYYTEIFVKLKHDYGIYTDDYETYADSRETEWKKLCEDRVRERYEGILADAGKELADAETTLADTEKEAYEKLEEGKKELTDATEQLADGERQLKKAAQDLDAEEQKLEEQTAGLQAQEAMLAQQEMLSGMTFPDMRAELEAGKAQLQAGKQQIQTARQEMTAKRKTLEENKAKLAEKQAEYDDSKTELDEKIAEEKQKIADARQELEEQEEPETYVLGRNTNVGYACFESDSNIVEGIANVFPVFFFMVAALVCMTTMNRMVEEERTQIGVLKALGYQERTIMGKYLFYAGSASAMGSVSGFLIGTYGFPRVIWQAYHIMYRLPELLYVFDWKLAVISVMTALICAMGVTWLTCRHELREVTAELMRPKAPKNGKRVILERIPFLWKRFKFLHKVAVRNIFRYKKRFFMMVIGIGGCTGLLLTGFGIKDSIADVAAKQYHEIQVYDMNVMLKEPRSKEENSEFMTAVTENAAQYMYACEMAMDMKKDKMTKSVNLVIPENPEQTEAFIQLHDEEGNPIPFPKKGEVVIVQKLADTYHLKIGDRITLADDDRNEITAVISGIAENFIYNYVYLNAETYYNGIGREPDYKTVYIKGKEGQDVHQASAAFMDVEGVSAVTVSEDIEERFDHMMASLDYIVLVIIICAGFLAFIVLYNLTNINITERIREIATIKVLGFFRNETASYVFRENMTLTAVGGCAGLIMGYFLHRFVMSQIHVDMVNFDVHISPYSYVYSLAFTFLFTCLINFGMSFKLDKINMAESLKSVD